MHKRVLYGLNKFKRSHGVSHNTDARVNRELRHERLQSTNWSLSDSMRVWEDVSDLGMYREGCGLVD
jgi:hypothetical protein